MFDFNHKHLTDIILFVAKNYLSSSLYVSTSTIFFLCPPFVVSDMVHRTKVRKAAALACVQIVPHDKDLLLPKDRQMLIADIIHMLLTAAMSEGGMTVPLFSLPLLTLRFQILQFGWQFFPPLELILINI